MAEAGMRAIARHGRRRRRALRAGAALAVGLAIVLSAVACGDSAPATVSSAGTLAALATAAPSATATPETTDDSIYRNQTESLSRTLGNEFTNLAGLLSAREDTEDWARSLSSSISQVTVQIDLLQNLRPPAEKYVEFDTALGLALDEYRSALADISAGLTTDNEALVAAGAQKLPGATASFEAAKQLMPEED